MEVKLLDLTRQYRLLQKQLEEVILEQFSSGKYIGGNAVSDFEKQFADYIGVEYAIAVNSGTDALFICMRALGIGKGDEVITTPFTFFATAESIAAIGAVPVFVDIEEETFNLDAKKIEEKITDRTKAILPVHIFGQPANMREICRIAEKHGLYVVEDACQAVGAAIGEQRVGSIGNAGCFSFFPTKNLGGFGDGGMITTNDEKIAVICRAIREHGGSSNGAKARFYLEGIEDDLAQTTVTSELYNPYKYYNFLIGCNSRLDAIQARILSVKLKHLQVFNQRREEIAQYYSGRFSGQSGIVAPTVRDGVHSVWHQYAIRCDHKREMGEYLAASGVGNAAFYPVPLHLQKAFSYLNYHEGDLPIAEKVTGETVCLPIYPELTREEIDYVADKVCCFVENEEENPI